MSKSNHQRPGAKRLRKRPGPHPFLPTSADRHRVQLAVATGMKLPEIASALEISRSSLSKLFATDIANGRAKRRLDNVCRLDKAAANGNVAAMRTLATMMATPATVETVEPNRWADLAAEYGHDITDDLDNSGRFPDFGKAH